MNVWATATTLRIRWRVVSRGPDAEVLEAVIRLGVLDGIDVQGNADDPTAAWGVNLNANNGVGRVKTQYVPGGQGQGGEHRIGPAGRVEESQDRLPTDGIIN